MDDDLIRLIDRIDERLQALGLTDRKASLAAIGKPDLIRDIRRNKRPLGSRLAELARVLGTTVDYLQGSTDRSDATPTEIETVPRIPAATEMDRDIPVYGTAIGAPSDYTMSFSGDVAIEQTDLNQSEVIDYFRRPPKLRERRDVYALYVAGDSMDPAFESGRGILVDPNRPPAVRDYVIVYLRNSESDGTVGVLIKRLVRRSASFLELEQFNPPATFRVDAKFVIKTHRVMPWDEAFGI